MGALPPDEQIHAPPPQAVLALDASASVQRPLQERLRQRPRLLALEQLQPMLRMPSEVLLELIQQLVRIQGAVVVGRPRGFHQRVLPGRAGQIPRHHLHGGAVLEAALWKLPDGARADRRLGWPKRSSRLLRWIPSWTLRNTVKTEVQ